MRAHLLAAWILLLAGAVAAWPQTDTAHLLGTIEDRSRAIVPGAKVTVTNLATNRSITADAKDGAFSLASLPPGRYKIEVTKEGFRTVAREATLEVGQVALVNFELEPGVVTETVNVTAEAALVDAANSAIGEVVQSRQVTEMPLNGRNFTQLATLVPGVTRGVPDSQASGANGAAETFRNGSNGGAALSVNGLRPQANNFILDGIDNNESLVNTIVFFPPAEAIEEFRVQTSVAPAEFGRAGGAVVNTSVKSGTNEYHGSAFEFLRNSALDAKPTFALEKNPFRRNQFGGTFGGPIVKDKVFAFGDYQGLRQSLPLAVDLVSVPTPEFRRGDFSALLDPARSGLSAPIEIRNLVTGLPFPGNIIPEDRINAVGRNYLNEYPQPNTGGGRVQQNYSVQRQQIQRFDDFDVRGDYIATSNDQIFGRFSYAQDKSTTTSRFPTLPAGFGSGANFNHGRGVAVGYIHTFSPTWLNELRGGFVRVYFGYEPPFADETISADLGIPNANTSPLLGGGALIGGFGGQLEYTGDFGPYLVPQNSYQFADAVSHTHGKHNIRFGGNIIRRQVNLFRPNRGKGYFFLFGNGAGPGSTGYETADVLAGFVNDYTIGPPFGMVGTRNWEMGYFAQDDWRISRKLTLNLGLRYDYFSWPVEVADRQANFDIATGQLLVAGQNGNSRSLIPADKNNFAPRAGFAYDFRGDGGTVIRGGYGMFYFLDRGGIDNQLAQNPPFSGFSQFRFTDGDSIALSGRAPAGNLNSTQATLPLPTGSTENIDLNHPEDITVFSASQDNVNSYVQQWNVQLQQQFWGPTVLSVGYVGTQGKKLMTFYDLNRQLFNAPPGARAFPDLGGVNFMLSRGNSIYHGLQTQLERRFTAGLQFRAAYTWSHAIDDSKGAFDANQPQDINNLTLERGNSDVDTRHRFVFSSLYEIPYGRGRAYGSQIPKALDFAIGGWQLNGILTLQSGFPFDVFTFGQPRFVRPDLVKSVEVFGEPDLYFDTSAFQGVPTGAGDVLLRPGTAGRNIVIGPGTKQLDLSVFKDFRITERVITQFRAEFFNITNTPQFAQPQGDITRGDFGHITSTRLGTERQVQFALRLFF